MKKCNEKILGTIIFIIMILLLCSTTLYAKEEDSKVDSFDEMKQKGDSFLEAGKDKGEGLISDGSIQGVVMPIAQTLVAIATAVVTVVTVIMGIKYMMAAPDAKGKMKQQLIGLVVSTIVIYGAQGIWALLYNFMSGVF